MTTATRDLAAMMIEGGTIEFRPWHPVRWASGNLMPIYNDNRRLMATPAARALAVRGFAEILERLEEVPAAAVGVATGGIVPATSLADFLGIDLYFVRSSVKDHGLGRQVEGVGSAPAGPAATGEGPPPDVIVIEDLVSTGGSTAAAVRAVRDAGLRTRFGLAVFSYGFAVARERFAALDPHFRIEPVVTIEDVIAVGERTGTLGRDVVRSIRAWLEQPFEWRKEVVS